MIRWTEIDWRAIVWATLAVFIGLVAVLPALESSEPPCASHHQSQNSTGYDCGQKPEIKEIAVRDRFFSWVAKDSISFFTFLLAIFTIVLAGASIWTGILTRRAIILARDEFNATHRPRIIVRAFQAVKEHTTAGETINSIFIAQNTGDSRGKVVEVRSGTIVFPMNKTLPTNFSFGFKDSFNIDLASGEHEIFPANGGHALTGEEWFRFYEGGSALYCIGVLTYIDGGNLRRETGFCRRYVPGEERWEAVASEYEYNY